MSASVRDRIAARQRNDALDSQSHKQTFRLFLFPRTGVKPLETPKDWGKMLRWRGIAMLV